MGGFRANVNVGKIVDHNQSLHRGLNNMGKAFGTLNDQERQRQSDLMQVLNQQTEMAREQGIRDVLSNASEAGQFGKEVTDGLNQRYAAVNKAFAQDIEGLDMADLETDNAIFEAQKQLTTYDENGTPNKNPLLAQLEQTKIDLGESRKSIKNLHDQRINKINLETQERYKNQPDFLDMVLNPEDAEQRLQTALMQTGATPEQARTEAAAKLKPYYAPGVTEREKLQSESDQKRIDSIRKGQGNIRIDTGSGTKGKTNAKGVKYQTYNKKTIQDISKDWYIDTDGIFSSGDDANEMANKLRKVLTLHPEIPKSILAEALDNKTKGVTGALFSRDRRVDVNELELEALELMKAKGLDGSGGSEEGTTYSSVTQRAPLSKDEQDEIAFLSARIEKTLAGTRQANLKDALGEKLFNINDTHYTDNRPVKSGGSKKPKKESAPSKTPGLDKAMGGKKGDGRLIDLLNTKPDQFVKEFELSNKTKQNKIAEVLGNKENTKLLEALGAKTEPTNNKSKNNEIINENSSVDKSKFRAKGFTPRSKKELESTPFLDDILKGLNSRKEKSKFVNKELDRKIHKEYMYKDFSKLGGEERTLKISQINKLLSDPKISEFTKRMLRKKLSRMY